MMEEGHVSDTAHSVILKRGDQAINITLYSPEGRFTTYVDGKCTRRDGGIVDPDC